MSVADALAQMQAIQARIAQIVPSRATTGTAGASGAFAAALGQATQAGSPRPPYDIGDISSGGYLSPAGSAASATTTATATTLAPAAITTTAAPVGGGADVSPYDDLIVQAATQNGVDPALLKALVRQESNFNPNAVSSAGAQGLTQLMPGTAAGFGVSNSFDPAQSLNAGARYLHNALQEFGGDESLALAAYNAGAGAVRQNGGIPPYPETQAYVPKVLAYAQAYRAAGFGQAAATPAATAAAPATTAAVSAQAAVGATGSSPAALQAVAGAEQYLGTPYKWGGSSPATGFDCSGLAQWAYAQVGVQLPRVAADQANAGVAVPRDQLQPGDLVFFADSSGYVHHEGIYVGGGRFLHAPHTGDVVKISSLNEPYYAGQFAGARRVG